MNPFLHARRSFGDPIRRRHLLAQFALVYGAAYLWTWSWWRALGITLTYFVGYEYVGEPSTRWLRRRSLELLALAAAGRPLTWWERIVIWLGRYSWVGPYFERGPREGETYGGNA
jgi:hypothetical protein